jgi:hypothetical protein
MPALQRIELVFGGKLGAGGFIWAQTLPRIFHRHRCGHSHRLSLEDFFLPFGGQLSGDYCWIRLADLVSWDELEDDCALIQRARVSVTPSPPLWPQKSSYQDRPLGASPQSALARSRAMG